MGGRKKGKTRIGNRLEKVRGNIVRWIVRAIVVAVGAFTLFIIGRNMASIIRSTYAIHRLEEKKAMYEAAIREDSILLERLTHDEYLERYAREKYHMLRDGEDVFLMDGDD